MLPTRRITSATLVVVLAASGLATACLTDREPAGPGVHVADSLGVEIVTNDRPAWSTASEWRVSTEPLLQIGGTDADERYSLFQVGRVVRLPDGRILLANGGTSQLRFYDPSGVHLYDVGQKGDGPGEFQSLNRLWHLPSDSIAVHDGRLSRLTVFDSRGTLARTFLVLPYDSLSQTFGMRPFADGTLLVEGIQRGDAARNGLFARGKRTFERYSAVGEPMSRIAEEPVGLNWGFTIRGNQGYKSAPFALTRVPSVSDGQSLYLGGGVSAQFRKVSSDGRVLRIVRWQEEPRRVTSESQDRYREEQLAGAADPEYPELRTASIEGIEFPERMPTFSRLIHDVQGCIWVERYRPSWESERRWWVFDPSGRWLGEPPVPTDLDLREVGPDYVLGVRRDFNDVEQVVMYALER